MTKVVKKNNKDDDFLSKVMDLNNKINSLDEIMYLKFVELSKVKTELLYQTEENKLLIDLYQGESEISIMKPKFTLLNCKYNMDEKKSACVLFRVKNIVYMTIIFKGEILEKSGKAVIEINMPIWKIYSGMFNIETLYNCLSLENAKKKEINKLCAKFEQKGNKTFIYINKNEFNVCTYWKEHKNSSFTIKANFFIEPPLRRRLGKFYIYNVLSDQVIRDKNNELILDNDWTTGCLLEIYEEKKEQKIRINNKYLNNVDNKVILENNKKLDNDIEFVPGFADIIQIILYIDKKPFFLTIEQNKLVLKEEASGNNQFLIIPEIK